MVNEQDSSRKDLASWNKVRSGNRESFAIIFHTYYEPLYQFAGKFVNDTQIAEDIVQNVFTQLWRERENRNIERNLKAYLYKMVYNHALNYIKREKRTISINETDMLSADSNDSPEELLDRKELQLKVQQAIEKLPQKCGQIYRMKRYDHLRYNEIAEILGVSINTVKTQMKRALQSLLEQLEPFLNQ
jgi:RNA polymerase sigma-70 factor (ECF subfamily)